MHSLVNEADIVADNLSQQHELPTSDNPVDTLWVHPAEMPASDNSNGKDSESLGKTSTKLRGQKRSLDEKADDIFTEETPSKDTSSWVPGRGKSVTISQLEKQARRHERLVQQALERGESPYPVSLVPVKSPIANELPSPVYSHVPAVQSDQSWNREKRKPTKPQTNVNDKRPVKRTRANLSPVIQPPIYTTLPRRRAAAKVNVVLRPRYTDENEGDPDTDETWTPNKREKKKAEIKRREGRPASKERSVKSTRSRRPKIPNTSFFRLEKVRPNIIETTPKVTNKAQFVGPRLLENVCKAMTRKQESLEQREEGLKRLGREVQYQTFNPTRIVEKDPFDYGANNFDSDDDSEVESLFEIHTEFGHKEPATWIPSLAKIRDHIPHHILPTNNLFWHFCLHQGVFDGNLETRAKYETEHVRRWSVLRDLKDRGMVDNLHIFNVKTPEKSADRAANYNGELKRLVREYLQVVACFVSYLALV